ncbi:MAG: hypothetical protein SPI59_06710 [Finegoldia sp.]|nr:hypothetical protein [Finegoldia sp.]
MKILINLVSLIIIIYNLVKRKNNLVKANIPTISIVVSILLAVFGFTIWFLEDKSILGLITVLNVVICFMSFYLAVGINEKYFNCLMANSIVIMSLAYSEINNIILTRKGNKLYVKFKAHSYEFLQEYNLEDEKQVLDLIDRRIGSNIYE